MLVPIPHEIEYYDVYTSLKDELQSLLYLEVSWQAPRYIHLPMPPARITGEVGQEGVAEQILGPVTGTSLHTTWAGTDKPEFTGLSLPNNPEESLQNILRQLGMWTDTEQPRILILRV